MEALPLHGSTFPPFSEAVPVNTMTLQKCQTHASSDPSQGLFDIPSIILHHGQQFKLQLVAIYILSAFKFLVLLSPTCLCQHMGTNDQII